MREERTERVFLKLLLMASLWPELADVIYGQLSLYRRPMLLQWERILSHLEANILVMEKTVLPHRTALKSCPIYTSCRNWTFLGAH